MRRKKGRFTLIELLVCIAVIMILVAMLMPALGRVKSRAKQTLCLNNMKQVVTANLMYAADCRQAWCPTLDGPLTGVGGATLPTPWRTYLLRWNKTGSQWWTTSNLHNSGHLGDPGPLFCSGVDTASEGSFGTIPSTNFAVRSSYFHSPYVDTSYEQHYLRLTKTQPEKLHAVETVGGFKTGRPRHGMGVNASRFDGSAAWHKSSAITTAGIGYTNNWAAMNPLVKAVEEDR